ncbi:hypothetical protein Y695_01068 [Hydrogenophaga sp. T4]|nr:hypothetical protein Y695_01068 [Hydrogenophaga sp. T4]
MASCTKPSRASQATSVPVAAKGAANGRVTSEEMTAPSRTEGTRSICCPCDWLRCTTVQLMAPAIGTQSDATEPSSRPEALAAGSVKALSIWLPYM